MSFREMVEDDINNVFLDLNVFGDLRTVIYDGERYEDIPIVMTGMKEKDRRQIVSDHAQGLYLVTRVVHCSLEDLNGVQPERGTRIKINEQAGGGGYFAEYYVATSVCEMGMLRLELEAIDE